MHRSTIRLAGALIAAAALFLAPASPLAAQVNMTGTWALAVDVDGSVTNPSVTLTQDGNALTGQYTSETLGAANVTGTVDGNSVTVRFTVDVGGQSADITYSGTVSADGVWSGTFDLAGLAGGTFTGTKS